MSERAVANLSLARLVQLEQRVLQAEDSGLRARWDFGRDLLLHCDDIEFACRRGGQFLPSGIDKTESDLWAWVLGRDAPQIAVVAPVALARAVKERAVREGAIRNTIRGSHPTNGAVVSLEKLLRWLLAEADTSERA